MGAQGGGPGAISLPKGGGALQGLGETFAPDLHTGTGNFSVPITLPPGRGGVQPSLALRYSTGHGNGPFGLGWTLSVPSVQRKTARGVPRYRDGAPDPRLHDVFVLSGAEDLVPVAGAAAGVTRYRPRTEGLFARIERLHGDDTWQVRTKDGGVTRYGLRVGDDAERAVIADPDEPGRVFAWQVSRTQDVFGNAVEYEYLRDRGSDEFHRWDQLYPRRIRYADHEAATGGFLVSLEFEYAERPDPFSDGRAGFEIRTRLRCTRITVRTHAGQERLARSYELEYADQRAELAGALPANGVSLLSRVRVVGHDGERTEEMPPLEFGYTRFRPEQRAFTALSGRDLPAKSLAAGDVELVDLTGDGLPDLLEMNGGARWWRNLGGGRFALPKPMREAPAGLSLGQPGVQLLDADGDGRGDLVVSAGALTGYYPLGMNGEWDRRSFRPYAAAPTFDLRDPEVHLVDLDGDGVTDAVRAGTRLECFYQDRQGGGWSEAVPVERRALSIFPDVTFSDPRIRWADMSGDGLQDVVMIHSGSVQYWPSHGWGTWGTRVTMRNSPRLPDGYDPRRLLLGDVDGDGAADLVYVEDTRVTLWINRGGNAWSEPVVIHGTPPVTDADAVRIADVLGTGVAGVLWSADAGVPQRSRLLFLDFTGGGKPYLLDRMDNHAGAVTTIQYRPSTRFYLDDEADPATRWQTPLPFPVQVVAKTTVTDALSGGTLTTEYRYHHGYWDGGEREFRGFGRVDHRDAELFAGSGPAPREHAPPTETRTWFHLGPVGPEHGEWAEIDLSPEFWSGDAPVFARPAEMTAALAELPRRARRDAARALRGRMLRTELYALDGSDLQDRPYTVTEALHAVREVDAPDPDRADRERIFFAYTPAERSTAWERGSQPLTRFTFSDDFTPYGDARLRTEIAAPRAGSGDPFLATHAVTDYAARDEAGLYLAGRAWRATRYEIPGEHGGTATALHARILAGQTARRVIGQSLTFYDGPAHQGLPAGTLGQYGAVTRAETLVLTEAILADAYRGGAAPTNPPEIPPFLSRASSIPWTAEYPAGFRAAIAAQAGHVFRPGDAVSERGWFSATSTRSDFHDGGRVRGLPRATRDPLGAETRIDYDDYALLAAAVTDPAGLVTRAAYDYRTLLPAQITDPNGGRTIATYSPLGLPETVAVTGKPGDVSGDTPDAPSLRYAYDFLAFAERGQPVSVRTVRRLHHAGETDVPEPERSETLQSVEYTDGFGRLLQSRAQAEDVRFGDPVYGSDVIPATPGAPAGTSTGESAGPGAVRVVVGGASVYDNKGRVIEQYEPRFSIGWAFAAPDSEPAGRRVSTFYDAAGRAVRVVNPDGSERRVVPGIPDSVADPDHFTPTPWETYTWDPNDNAGRTHPDAVSAAWRAHRDTPSSAVMDALGRTVRATVRNGPDPATDWFTTRSTFDVRGNLLTLEDELGRPVYASVYDLANRPLRTERMDAGVRRTVLDAAGRPVESRDGKGALTLYACDAAGRPVRTWARDAADHAPTLRTLTVWGDTLPPAQADAGYLRGRVWRQYDEAGTVTLDAYDFKGAVLEKVRRVLSDAEVLSGFDPKAANGYAVTPYRVNWEPPAGTTLDQYAAKVLDAAEFRTSARFDALGRVRALTQPLDVNGGRKVVRPGYDRAGRLRSVRLDGDVYVERIAYDARGQRTLIAYGNGVMTRYAYDPDTFRLSRLLTEAFTHPGGNALAFAPRPDRTVLQELAYAYDLAGNLVTLQDRTPASGVASNPDAFRETDPVLRDLLSRGEALVRRFEYDPLYRLTSATGRECKVTPAPRPWGDDPRCAAGWTNYGTPGGDNAPTLATTCREQYAWDPAGNLLSLSHATPTVTWTRRFGVGGRTPQQWAADWPAHLNTGAAWTGAPGNRMTHAGDAGASFPATHAYDASGNLVSETTTRLFTWDHADRLTLFRVQPAGARPSVYAFYLYDAAGARVKKVWARQGSPVESAVYVDGAFERRAVGTQRCDTLHVMDDARRIALVRIGSPLPGDSSPAVQYQLADHLGSSALVVDGAAGQVSREEFSPFGETLLGSFAKKRYRFTGKERDEESGLYYHGARYYAPHLARWSAADPAGYVDGMNLYRYCRGNPVVLTDPRGTNAMPKGPEAEVRAQLERMPLPSTLPMLTPEQLKDIDLHNRREATISTGHVVQSDDVIYPRHMSESPLIQYEGQLASTNQIRKAEGIMQELDAGTAIATGFAASGAIGYFLGGNRGAILGAKIGDILSVTAQVVTTRLQGNTTPLVHEPPAGASEFSRFAQRAFAGNFDQTEALRTLWNEAARGKPSTREGFAQAREAFWRSVNTGTGENAATVRGILREAGYELQGGSNAPLRSMTGWDPRDTREIADRRLSIDHADPQSVSSGTILNPSNLRFMTQRDNSTRGARWDANDRPR
jgi:RHS repeat-associated protein